MSFLSTALLAVSLSSDAFAVAVGRGAASPEMKWGKALRTGAVFGLSEGTMPLIGWLIGRAASEAVESVDHWIAFVILSAVGFKMIKDGWGGEKCCSSEGGTELPGAIHTLKDLWMLILTAIGTSIDSLAIGISLAFMKGNILISAAGIGFSSFFFSTLGLKLGQWIGCRIGSRAEIGGGIVLIGIGLEILASHLGISPF